MKRSVGELSLGAKRWRGTAVQMECGIWNAGNPLPLCPLLEYQYSGAFEWRTGYDGCLRFAEAKRNKGRPHSRTASR